MFTTTLSLSWRLASTITSTSFSIPTAPACFATGLCAQRLATLVDEYTATSSVLVDFFDIAELVEASQLVHTKLDYDEEFITHESDSATSSYGEDDSYSSSATSSSPPSPLFESEGKFDASPIDYLDLALQAGPPSSIPEAIDSPPSPTLSLPVLEVSSIPSFELIPELAAKMVIAFPRSSRPFTHNIRLYQDVDYSSSEASSSRSTLEISSLPIIDFNIEFVPETVLEPIIPLLGSFQTPISTTTTGPITATTLF